MGVVMGFDFGTKRIGIAVGQAITSTASPLDPVSATDGKPHWDVLDRVIAEWQPESIVVGLPLNMDGSLCEMSYRARKFANRLEQRYQVTTYLMDERLTSHEAKGIHLSQGGEADFKANSMDGLAAQLILESWFREPEKKLSRDKL